MEKWLSLLCSLTLLLTGCTQTSSGAAPEPPEITTQVPGTDDQDKTEIDETENQAFEDFCSQYIIDVCENDYSTCHLRFIHPENYGIDISKAKITLGEFLPDSQSVDFDRETLDRLKSFDTAKLTPVNQNICEQLKWEMEIMLEDSQEKYNYLSNIWSVNNNPCSSLVTFFSEYMLNQESDIEPLIELIHQVPDYLQQALDYTAVQAEKGLLGINMDDLLEQIKEVTDNEKNSSIRIELDGEVDALMLEEAKAKEYKEQIHQALQDSFFPAYRNLLEELPKFKDKNNPVVGLAAHANGRELYELELRYYSGCRLDIDDTLEELETKMDDMILEFQELQLKNPSAASKALNLETKFTDISQIMPFLDEHYTQSFPLLDSMDYEMKPLSKEQSQPYVVAYFLIPPVDSTRPYEIRYNVTNYGDDPSSFELYNTFAHEGIPGHMYQFQYEKQNNSHTIQFFLNSMGFSEGYAVYAAERAQTWQNLESDLLKAYKLNENYTYYMALVMDLQINGLGMDLEAFNEEYGEGLEKLYYQLAESPGVFFSYYYGSYKIEQLRSKAEEALKKDFDEVEFNNSLLASGSVNFDIIEKSVDAYIASKTKGKE